MLTVLLVLLVLGVLVVLGVIATRRRGAAHPGPSSDARAAKLAADQAVIQRQGGQGMGQGGVGGGMGA